MLFVSNPPIKIQVHDDRKIIVLTKNKIMFTHLDFIEEYLAMPLITGQPLSFYYSPETMQTLVQSANTLQIYYCDWKTQIMLMKIFILHTANIDTIYYDKKLGWNVVGSVYQYDTAKLTFKASPALAIKNDQKILGECYIGSNYYRLTSNNLIRMEKDGEEIIINWKDRMMVLKNCNYEITMQGASSADRVRDILCINAQYTLIVKKAEVITTVDTAKTIYIRNSLLINETSKGHNITINVEKCTHFSDIGIIPAPKGKLYSSFLYDNQLAMLYYNQKQVHINLLPLAQDNQNKKTQGQTRKKLCASISKIMEDPQQDMSQYVSNIKPAEEKSPEKIQIKQEQQSSPVNRYNPQSKAIIKDIVCADDEIIDDQLNKSNSEVLSRSGIDFADCSEIQGNGKNNDFSLGGSNEEELKKNNFNNSNQLRQSDNSFKLSETNQNAKKKLIKQKSRGHSNKGSDNSMVLQDLVIDDAETPGFGFAAGDWGTIQKNWQQAMGSQINQDDDQLIEDQSLVIDEKQRTLLKSMPGIPTKKIQYFRPKGVQLTKSVVRQIETSSYSKLIQKICDEYPERFDELLDEFMWELLQEKQSALLFANKIQTHNPKYTKDKIKIYFRSYLGKDIYKAQMTNSLQQFKLSEVPEQALKFPQQFIKVLTIIYKDLYISDILHASESTVQMILDSYFHNNYSSENQIIIIEDQEIDITHPRNMLNILLYLNQYFNLEIDSILRVYCKKLIQNEHFDVLRKIINEKIFEICQVNRSVLDQIIQEVYKEYIYLSQIELASQLIEFISENLHAEYKLKTKIFIELDKYGIIYDHQSVLKAKNPATSIYIFLENIIIQNSCKNLVKFRLQEMYQTLYILQEGTQPRYETNEYIDLTKSLIEKFCEGGIFNQAFKLIKKISSFIKISYICHILYKYADSKFINRLARVKQLNNLQKILPEFFRKQQINIKSIKRDVMNRPQQSQCISCPWETFLKSYNKHCDTSSEIRLLTYLNFNCAYQLFLRMSESDKKKFNKFYVEIQDNIKVQVDDMNENDESINPKGKAKNFYGTNLLNSPNHLQLQQQIKSGSQAGSLTLRQQQQLLYQFDDKTKTKSKNVFKSMKIINSTNLDIRESLQKVNSDKKAGRQIQNDQDIERLKWLVDKKQILEALEEIYNRSSASKFIKSLQVIDLQKINLYHIDTFKMLASKQLDYPIERIVSFKLFTIKDRNQAFQLIINKIRSEITLKSFWVIYLMMDILLGKGVETGKIFLQKIIKYYQNDDLAHVVQELVNATQMKGQKQYLKQMYGIAKEYNQENIASVLMT